MNSLGWLAQDAGSMITLRFPRSRSMPNVSLFENNNYIRLLNQTLLMELGAVELYQHCALSIPSIDAGRFATEHQNHAQALTVMIISNRGIPDKEKFSFPSEISLFASRIGRHLPEYMARRTNLTSCIRLEKALRRRYYLALTEAPYRDRAQLHEHVRCIKAHLDLLNPSH